jgi:hypothetical protein
MPSAMNRVLSLVNIATDLVAQFQTTVGRMASAAAAGDDDTLSSLRAEAERLFTAIWEHLDDAAKHTGLAGRSAEAYATIRADVGVGPGINGIEAHVVAIERKRDHDVVTTRGTVQYNTEGVARARAAVSALHAAWPDLDWSPVAAAPDVDLRPRGLLARLFGRR